MSSKRAQKTRTEILDAAWDLVAERGAEVSMAAIAQTVGVSRQAVYLHFGSRGGLLVALVTRADERFKIMSAFAQAMDEKMPRTRIRAMFLAWFDFVEKVLPVATDLIRLQSVDEDAAVAWEGRMAVLYAELLRLARSLKRDNALGEGWQVEEAADYMFSVTSMQVWELLTRERSCDLRRAKDILCSAMVSALEGPVQSFSPSE